MDIEKIKDDVSKQLANPEVLKDLIDTTFKGMQPQIIKQAILAGIIRGFSFRDFLEKNIYAIPFGNSYSLVTSIDYARKLGMRNGVVGIDAPIFEEKDGRIISCETTVHRKIGEYIGKYTAKVYFSEYTTGKNLWASKPRTMITKVSQMHALRMACPEELSQLYTVDEMGEKVTDVEVKTPEKLDPIKVDTYAEQLKKAKDLNDLKTIWSAIPFEAKEKLTTLKDQLKTKLQ